MPAYKLPKDEWTYKQTRLRCKHTAEWRRHVAHDMEISKQLVMAQEQERQQCEGDLFLLRQQHQQTLAILQQQHEQIRQALRSRQAEEMVELREQMKAARRGML